MRYNLSTHRAVTGPSLRWLPRPSRTSSREPRDEVGGKPFDDAPNDVALRAMYESASPRTVKSTICMSDFVRYTLEINRCAFKQTTEQSHRRLHQAGGFVAKALDGPRATRCTSKDYQSRGKIHRQHEMGRSSAGSHPRLSRSARRSLRIASGHGTVTPTSATYGQCLSHGISRDDPSASRS